MTKHWLSCGCQMNEGDPRSTHASHDYRGVSCESHIELPQHVWPHHVDESTRLTGYAVGTLEQVKELERAVMAHADRR